MARAKLYSINKEPEPADASNDVVPQGLLLAEQILIDFDSGMTRKAISKKHSTPYSTVCKIIREAKKEPEGE